MLRIPANGIGRPRGEASVIPTLVDRMLEVYNLDLVTAMRVLSDLLGYKVGRSTCTNFVGMLALATEMVDQGQQGSILSLLRDAGERYLPTYHDAVRVDQTLGDCTAAQQRI